MVYNAENGLDERRVDVRYTDVYKAVFIRRLNRFTAEIEINGGTELCHVKNTGRLKELLLPKAAVFVQRADNPNRKTKWDLIAVQTDEQIVNIDSQAPNRAVKEWLEKGGLGKAKTVRPETVYTETDGTSSRFDFYIEFENGERAFAEVKGVTLKSGSAALFPDAPTERGIKHVRGLCDCVKNGYKAYVLFAVQMQGVLCFMPNDKTHLKFGEALRKAKKEGVRILAYTCRVLPDSMEIKEEIPVKL